MTTTTLNLSIDKDNKRFLLDDGPNHVHAGETVTLRLKGIGVTAAQANGADLIDGAVDVEQGTDTAATYPSLRVRLVHPVYGDLAMYPWPSSPPNWAELDQDNPGAGLVCEMDLDTEQLFRVVRSGVGKGLVLFVERPWPESAPTVYGIYEIDVWDWPDATGEARTFPSSGRYANAFGKVFAIPALEGSATLTQTIDTVNAMLGALKALAKRSGSEEEDQ